ncbi:Dps family protein [Sutterella sp.]|uniref:Dps family protein n=1 Tax=Sutterella sp. TaxID=1981025 RepID=UPI0025D8675A|nr:DNA starvation/stationary phase protection protein [uncultured Sutterella sp.]
MTDAAKLNAYVASLLVWNVKLHNLHWNVEGRLFKAVHDYTESLYDEVFAAYDETAELLKMRGDMPVASLKDSLALSVIEEAPSERISCCAAVAAVEADITKMAALAREIRSEAAEADDFQVQGVFEGYLARFAKELWFLRAMRSEAEAAACAPQEKAPAKRCCRTKKA